MLTRSLVTKSLVRSTKDPNKAERLKTARLYLKREVCASQVIKENNCHKKFVIRIVKKLN